MSVRLSIMANRMWWMVLGRRGKAWLWVALTVVFLGACAQGDAPVEPQSADVGESDHKNKSEVAAPSPNDLPPAAAAATAAASAMPEGKGRGGGKQQTSPKTWKRSQTLPHSSKLMVGDRESLTLRGMQVKARIDGFRARVVIDYYYANLSSRTYEGTFKMRLPDGASPYFFAFGETSVSASAAVKGTPQLASFAQARGMGVAPELLMKERQEHWSKPKEARMVPRNKAARAYHNTVRRSVDPALMEWAGAGIFSARVFPLAPGKVHRIVVGYDVDLLALGDAILLDIDLPADVPHVAVDFDVAKTTGTTLKYSDGAETMELKGRSYARYTQPKQRQLRLIVTPDRDWMLVGEDSHIGPHFAATFAPNLPATTTLARARNAVLLIDTSLSANPDKFNIWLKLAEALLSKNRDRVKNFAVMFFNVEARWWREGGLVENTDANVQAFLKDAQATVLEGATDLGAALRQAGRFINQAEVGADVFLLSDGAATWGEDNLYALSRNLRNAPVFAYRTGMSGSDSQTLTHLARETGGAVFSVMNEGEIKTAARAHRQRPWELVKVEMEGASELMLKGRPRVLFRGQRLAVVGRGTPQGALVLTLKRGEENKILRKEFAQLTSPLAPRSYGTVAVQQLEALEAAAAKLAVAYSSHYRVTGKSSSLLMLDSEEDYRARGVMPEDHAKQVKAKNAATAVTAVLRDIETSLGDPKVGFMNWLDALSTIPGAEVTLPSTFRKELEQLTVSRFAVPSAPLVVKQTTAEGVPEAFLTRLKQRKIDYDAFASEAARRLEKHGAADALKAFSSMVEHSPGDTVLARDIAGYASLHGLDSHAYHLLRRVAHARAYEPQTYLSLARAAVRSERPELAMAYFEIALSGKWDARFGDFRRIVQLQYTRLLRQLTEKGELSTGLKKYANGRLATLKDQLQLDNADIVVVIMWNTDSTDIDLHVVEPSREECFYSHRDTKSGGHMSTDVTQGYGPEMYTLKKAPAGDYAVRVKYFSSNRNRASARTKIQALVFRNWGRADETLTEKVVTLEDNKAMHDIVTIQQQAH